MPLSEIILLCVFGALGALFKDIVVDGKVTMPKRVGGDLSLGFIGSIFVGAVIGYLADNSPITAFSVGFAGFTTLASLLPNKLDDAPIFYPEPAVPATPSAGPTAFKIEKPFDGDFSITQKFGDNPAWYVPSGYAGHFGLDYATPWGTPILACNSGTVSRVGFTSGNGNFIELKHSWGLSLYCHFNKLSTKKIGETISKRDVIGYAGNTGAVRPAPTPAAPRAGTHLHFSTKINGISNPTFKDWVDPTPFFI